MRRRRCRGREPRGKPRTHQARAGPPTFRRGASAGRRDVTPRLLPAASPALRDVLEVATRPTGSNNRRRGCRRLGASSTPAPWTASRRARPEAEKAKGLEEKGSDAWSLEGRRCRSARYGGTFTYSLRLPAEGPAALRVAYWGGESRRHAFEVVAEGETIATQSLFDDRPGEVLEVEYPLPERLTRGRERLRVGFRTGPRHLDRGGVRRADRPSGQPGSLIQGLDSPRAPRRRGRGCGTPMPKLEHRA